MAARVLEAGDQFGRYVVEARLGEGGMGIVYRARDTRLGRRVALKVLHESVSDASDPAGRLLRQARAAAALDHPHAAVIYDVGEVDGRPYLAMELVTGRTLRSLMDEEAQPLTERMRWLTQIAGALAAAHRHGIVHGDVKPENVMVREDGVIKVLDFGLARAWSATVAPGSGPQSPTRAAEARGVVKSPSLATERLEGEPLGAGPHAPTRTATQRLVDEPLDAQADQLAWGVVAYELLTGAPPWGSQRVATEVLAAEVAPIRERVPEVPEAIERAVTRALARDPQQRWPTMSDTVVMLEAVATRTAALKENRGRRSRARILVGLAVAGALAIVAFSCARRRGSARPPVKQPIAETPSIPGAGTTNPAALAAYLAGVQAFRDAAHEEARRSFGKAAELDPTFAAAHLRYVLTGFVEDEACREHLRMARQWRSNLSEEDQALLEAIAPFHLIPPELDEAEHRLEDVIRRYPKSTDALFQLSGARGSQMRYEEALEPIFTVLKLDPKMIHAHLVIGVLQATLGKSAAAITSFQRCVALSPVAISCIQQINELQREEGLCHEAEESSRRLLSLAPGRPESYVLLATSLYAQGVPTDAVEQAVLQGRQHFTDDAEGDAWYSLQRSRLAVLRGHLDEAEQLAREFESRLPPDAVEEQHAAAARERIQLFLEMGRNRDASEQAFAFLRARSGWTPSFPISYDPAIFADVARYQAGTISRAEFFDVRDRWLASQSERFGHGEGAFGLWVRAYALGARTRADAELALSMLDRYGPVPPPHARDVEDDLAVGSTFRRAGRAADALTFLRRAATSCNVLFFPLGHTQALAEYGEALASTGAHAEACAVFEKVIARWGTASPNSVTRDRVRPSIARCR